MRKIEVFLIEDDTDDQEVFSMVLQEIDPSIHCSFANNGIEGLERLKPSSSFQPDFIFIDLNMPMMNGIDCLREIKKNAHLANSRTIIYTTSSDEKFLIIPVKVSHHSGPKCATLICVSALRSNVNLQCLANRPFLKSYQI